MPEVRHPVKGLNCYYHFDKLNMNSVRSGVFFNDPGRITIQADLVFFFPVIFQLFFANLITPLVQFVSFPLVFIEGDAKPAGSLDEVHFHIKNLPGT